MRTAVAKHLHGGQTVPRRAPVQEFGVRRLRNTEFVLPIVVGTIAFHLGKKVSSLQGEPGQAWAYVTAVQWCAGYGLPIPSLDIPAPRHTLCCGVHSCCASPCGCNRWSVLMKLHPACQVRFDLHHTFSNANRLVDHQPFEVTEHGWGEFDIVIHVMFTPDSSENEVILYHKLKLYEDGEQVSFTADTHTSPTTPAAVFTTCSIPGSRQDPKRPVVSETLEELVFYEPRADFYQRLVSYRPREPPALPGHTTTAGAALLTLEPLHPLPQLAPYFQTPNEALELELISSWRTKVATVSNDMRREIMALHGTLPMGLAQGGQGRISPLPALPPLPGM
ncbi:hypothetical protein QJQ45_024022 [Haematococcus lacustris]|nr:hypothetical protein QJQ45_024022 [Haematococcus lacustris]